MTDAMGQTGTVVFHIERWRVALTGGPPWRWSVEHQVGISDGGEMGTFDLARDTAIVVVLLHLRSPERYTSLLSEDGHRQWQALRWGV